MTHLPPDDIDLSFRSASSRSARKCPGLIKLIEALHRTQPWEINLQDISIHAVRDGFFPTTQAFHDRIYIVANSLDRFEIKPDAYRRVMSSRHTPATVDYQVKVRALILQAILLEHADLLGKHVHTPRPHTLQTIVFSPKRK